MWFSSDYLPMPLSHHHIFLLHHLSSWRSSISHLFSHLSILKSCILSFPNCLISYFLSTYSSPYITAHCFYVSLIIISLALHSYLYSVFMLFTWHISVLFIFRNGLAVQHQVITAKTSILVIKTAATKMTQRKSWTALL